MTSGTARTRTATGTTRTTAGTGRTGGTTGRRTGTAGLLDDGPPASTSVGQLLGYARVSTRSQDVAPQVDVLERAGCIRVWTETVTGGPGAARPELTKLLAYARPGDVLVVARLDRLGRSLRELVDLVEQLHTAGVGLRSLHEAIDTTSAAGRLVLHVFAALAEFERGLLRERTHAGLDAARARGRRGGRPTVMTTAKLEAARAMAAAGSSLAEIAAALDVGKTTVRRHLTAADATPTT